MKHPDEEKLSAFMEGDLPLEEKKAVESHVSECARCTEALERMRRMVTSLSQLPELTPPVDLRVRIMDRVSRGESWGARVWRWFTLEWLPIPARLAGTVAVALLVVGVGLWLTPEQWRNVLDQREAAKVGGEEGRHYEAPALTDDDRVEVDDVLPGLKPAGTKGMRALEKGEDLDVKDEAYLGSFYRDDSGLGRESADLQEDFSSTVEGLEAPALADRDSGRFAYWKETEKGRDGGETAASGSVPSAALQYGVSVVEPDRGFEDEYDRSHKKAWEGRSAGGEKWGTERSESFQEPVTYAARKSVVSELSGSDTVLADRGEAAVSGERAPESVPRMLPEGDLMNQAAMARIGTSPIPDEEAAEETLTALAQMEERVDLKLGLGGSRGQLGAARMEEGEESQEELEKLRTQLAKMKDTMAVSPRRSGRPPGEVPASRGVQCYLEAADTDEEKAVTGMWSDRSGSLTEIAKPVGPLEEQPDEGLRIVHGGSEVRAAVTETELDSALAAEMVSGGAESRDVSVEGKADGIEYRELPVAPSDEAVGRAGKWFWIAGYGEGGNEPEAMVALVAQPWRVSELPPGFDLVIRSEDIAGLEERIDRVAFSNGWTVVEPPPPLDEEEVSLSEDVDALRRLREEARVVTVDRSAHERSEEKSVDEGNGRFSSMAVGGPAAADLADVMALVSGEVAGATRVVRLQVPARVQNTALVTVANQVKVPTNVYFQNRFDNDGDGRVDEFGMAGPLVLVPVGRDKEITVNGYALWGAIDARMAREGTPEQVAMPLEPLDADGGVANEIILRSRASLESGTSVSQEVRARRGEAPDMVTLSILLESLDQPAAVPSAADPSGVMHESLHR